MTERLDYTERNADLTDILQGLEPEVEETTFDPPILEFVKLRASQINGCAFCVDLHTRKLRETNVDSRKTTAVAVWH